MKHVSLNWNSLCTQVRRQLFPSNAWKRNQPSFSTLTGRSVEDFDCLFDCVEPYIRAMMYTDCKTPQQRKLTKRTELMCFMTVCRHTLHLGIVGYMTGTSISTQSRIFTALAVFLSTLFDQVDREKCFLFYLWIYMHQVSRTQCCWETAQRTGLLQQKTLTSAKQHLADARAMTLTRQEFGYYLLAVL